MFALIQKKTEKDNWKKNHNCKMKAISAQRFAFQYIHERDVKLFPEIVVQACSVKKVFLEISQNSQENTFARVPI